MIQRVGRGFLGRKRVRDMRTINMVADELWRLKTVREREALQLKIINDDPDAALLPGGSHRGTHISKQIGRSGDHVRTSSTHTQRSRAFQFKVIDVDTMVDTSDMYPRGWSTVYGDLDAALARGNQRIECIALGKSHCVALDSTGYLWTWGWGDRGQLGHGNWSNYGHPRKLEMLAYSSDGDLRHQGQRRNAGSFGHDIGLRTQIRQIAVGDDHCIALSASGQVWTWGSGVRGQLGHGWPRNGSSGEHIPKFRVKSHTPRKVQTLKRTVVEIAAGAHHSVALVNAGSVYVWGAGKQLGLGVFVGDGDRALPTCVKALTKFRVRHIGCGNTYTAATTHSGDVYTWGVGSHGQLGQGDLQDRVVPCVIRSLRGNAKHGKIADVACGAQHAVAMTGTGKCYAWGWNQHGQLGLGHRDDVLNPTMILALRNKNVVSIAAGYRSSMCILQKGAMWAWGMCGCVVRPLKGRNNGNQHMLHHDFSRDPDADNTQFETSVPLQVPWNHNSGRRPMGVIAAFSRSASILQVRYRHEGSLKRKLARTAQPLLLNRAQLLAEADSLLTDHESMDTRRIRASRNGEMLTLRNNEIGNLEKERSTITENPFAVLREDLDVMDMDQLKSLIIDLQNSTPERLKISPSRYKHLAEKNRRAAGKYNALSNSHKLRKGRNDTMIQLQYKDPDERAVEHGLRTYQAGDTRGELLANYSFRSRSEYAIERAREHAWKGTGKYRRYKGGVQSPFDGEDSRTGRPKTQTKTYAIESKHRTELLRFSSKHEEDREAFLAKQKDAAGIITDESDGLADPALFPRSAQPKKAPASQALTDLRQGEINGLAHESELQAAIERIRIEGVVDGGAILDFFTPEQLVATSNDDLAVQDVMRMRLERGENISPLTPRRKVVPSELAHLISPVVRERHTPDKHKQNEGRTLTEPITSNSHPKVNEEDSRVTVRNIITTSVPDPRQQNRRYTMKMQNSPQKIEISQHEPDPVAIAIARERQRMVVNGRQDTKKPDVLDLYREQQHLKTIPSYSGNFQKMVAPGAKHGQWSGRRQSRADEVRGIIQDEIFGEEDDLSMNSNVRESFTSSLPSQPNTIQENLTMAAEVATLRAQLEAMKARNTEEESRRGSVEKAQVVRLEKEQSLMARRNSSAAKSEAASVRRRASHSLMNNVKSTAQSDITAMIESIKRKADADVNGLLQKHGGSPTHAAFEASKVPLPSSLSSISN